MSLEELRAQAEEAEETKAEQPEAEEETEGVEGDEPEAEQEESEEPEAEEAEESEDFELELEGESTPDQQEKPSKEQVYFHKLMKERDKRKDRDSEVAELRAELEALKSGRYQAPQQAPKQPQAPEPEYPPVPLLYENGIDTPEQYSQAYQKWVHECKRIDEQHAQRRQANDQYAKAIREKTEALARRAAKFATEHKVSSDVMAEALNRATDEIDGSTGIEGSLSYLLDAVGDGAERAAWHIGRNAEAAARIKRELQEDPNGFKALATMTRWSEKLKPKHSRKVSKAPKPDQPLRGDGSQSGSIAKKLQSRWDKATKREDLMAIRREAREAGVKLDT